MAEVLVYSKAVCPYCDRAKMLLNAKGIDFKELRVDLDPVLLDEMLAKSEGRRTVPQIFINGKGVGGFDELWSLEQQNKLDDLLIK